MSWVRQVLHAVFHPYLHSWARHTVSTFGISAPIVPLWFGWRRRAFRDPAVKWLMIYLAVTLVEDIFMIYWTPRNNLWLIHLYTPAELVMMAMMFAGWQLRDRWRTVIIVTGWVFVAWWAVMMFTVEDFLHFPRFTKAVASLLVISAAAWTLVQRTRMTVSPLTRHPWFWVSVGTMIYFAWILLLNPVAFVLLDASPKLVGAMFDINGVLVVVMYLFWLKGLLLVPLPRRVEVAA